MANPDPGVRVTAAQVIEIISTDLGEPIVNAFINSAHVIVEENLSGKGLSAGILIQIELWLTAHLLSMRDQRKKSVKVDEIQITYQGETGLGLESTLYGQQALALDKSHTLATMGKKRAVLQVE